MKQNSCDDHVWMGQGPAHRCGSVWGTMIQCEKCKAKDVYDGLIEALEDMCAEFRDHDLPYGSAAYQKAISAINKARSAS